MAAFLGGCIENPDSPHQIPPPSPIRPTVVSTETVANDSLPPSPTAPQNLTEIEEIEYEMETEFGHIHPACTSDTGDPLPPDANCRHYLAATVQTTTQWIELFPQTHFYLIKFDLATNCSTSITCGIDDYQLIAQQDNNRFRVKEFNQLLKANGILISDENRQLVAESAILMWLAEFVQEEISFAGWQAEDSQNALSLPDYNVRAQIPSGTLHLQIRFDESCLEAVTITEIEVIESDNSLYDIFYSDDYEMRWQC